MKDLSNLSPAEGSHRSRKRLGRGPGSGQGKTAGKGHKGQKARKGGGIAPGFEGGQTPLYRRLPKRGFSNKSFKITYNLVKLEQLNQFDDGTVVTQEVLQKAGLLKSSRLPTKLLANGELTKKVSVELKKITGTARAAVEKVGGTVKEL